MDVAFRRAVAEARRQRGLYFASLLSEERIEEAFGLTRALWQGWIYTPAVTIWVFLSQCLSADHSCREAVAGLIAWRLGRGQSACSAETGAYCTAREDVPEEVCRRLMRETGRQVDEAAPVEWRWRGHRVLADRYFSGWFDLALLQQRGAHAVVRKHQLRATDFRTGKRLGRHDHLVTWSKPARPEWMSREQYAALPDSLTLREVRVLVEQKGFRTQELVVVTTLLDPEQYPADAIAQLYRRRWQAELNLRSLKIVLQMDHLRCKTPHRVRNEFFMHLVAYNLIRHVMAAAATRSGVEPWTVSFKGALQTLGKLLPLLELNLSTDCWCDALLDAIAAHVVGNRPDRFEPRLKKRRPKPFKLMREPRDNYKRRAA